MSKEFDRLVEIMTKLRAPDGCPWDKEQTHETLKPYLIEETYEVLEAIESGDPQKIKEELGDLLLQVVFHAQMGMEAQKFTIDDVAKSIADKLERRHPHVFEESDADTPEKVIKQWEEIKGAEEAHKERSSALDGVPKAMPSMLKALKLQKKASRAGFDWERVEGAFTKVDEELEEFRHAFAHGSVKEMEEELGDLFFSLINVARFLEVNPEEALTKTISKFVSRFQHLEGRVKEEGKSLTDTTLAEMDKLWDEAKRKENDTT